MADTPNNDIEKQLRDYAQQRRAAVGTPEMHPATRAMLQAEVKQRHGGAGAVPTTTPRADWLRFWPRLGFALGVIVILGVAAFFLVPPGNKPKENFALAKLEEATPARNMADKLDAAPVPASAPAALPVFREVTAKPAAPAPSVSLKTEAASFERRRDAPARAEPSKAFKGGGPRDLAKTSSGSAAGPYGGAAQNGRAVQTVGQGFNFSDGERAKEAPTISGGIVAPLKAARMPVQADATAVIASKDLKTPATLAAAKNGEAVTQVFNAAKLNDVSGYNNAGLAQRYRNVAVTEKQKQISPPVLDEFTVAQNGEALTVIDRDGSIYNGYARPASATRQNVSANFDYANPIQMVPNAGGGGRGGGAFDQRAQNRAYEQNQNLSVANVSQNLAVGQGGQSQNSIATLNCFFRVEGTNRSLNERVVFTGNLLQNVGFYNNSAGNFQNNAGTQNFQQQQAAPPGNAVFNGTYNAPVLNNVINGRVQLGDKKADELNALSVGQ